MISGESGTTETTIVPTPALRGVELIEGRCAVPPPTHLFAQLTIVLCDAGGGDVSWGRMQQTLTAGSVLIRAPLEVGVEMQRILPDTQWRLLLLEPDTVAPAPSSAAAELLRCGSVVTRLPSLNAAIDALFSAARAALDPGEQQTRLAALMSAVFAVAETCVPRPPPLSPAVARTRDALNAHFAEDVPLERLAQIAGMSKCHLVHLFHREVGLPPHAYQIQLRVARARSLVAAGVPIAEVATMTGFADQSHLTRLFKRVVGIPPGQYAARHPPQPSLLALAGSRAM